MENIEEELKKMQETHDLILQRVNKVIERLKNKRIVDDVFESTDNEINIEAVSFEYVYFRYSQPYSIFVRTIKIPTAMFLEDSYMKNVEKFVWDFLTEDFKDLQKIKQKRETEQERHERALLKRLKAKYEKE